VREKWCIGGVLRHLPVWGKPATESTLYWQRSLAKAPLYRDLATTPTAHQSLTTQVGSYLLRFVVTILWPRVRRLRAYRRPTDTAIRPAGNVNPINFRLFKTTATTYHL
ncbi:unnamed protein product, partial [Laminaria digitata]